ncbi:NAD(P)H:quinone oxidoreductase [Actinoalloteichus hymeniacidonis]|uniref:NAD(P)H:quinone oxidoreductase, type IV n=1 Tax=Actinoalloteichus hymeniacidonis TaxID=340345 RepID=A0AAC9HLX7_9PSEU|nr:NAD(P)H:quinone oxidoreductase [Actinoalloteichus hymeniacidonis]AOS61732.1 NAD(P)H:quinone oxidoreductase, type IV [Actinoalloteichus hymeniacidonis]MBB5910250.1 NAD(P)H dehydrogenase (quinone) [Actinoalloteichus hymeniacidonis]
MSVPEPTKVAIIYYSSTGNVYTLAQSILAGAEQAGAEVRLRKVHELAPPEAIAANPAWQEHARSTESVAEATADDVLWADAVVFGTPTRYGNVAAQLKQFIDTLGPQWSQGLLADKIYSGFVSTATLHGGRESTLLALYNTVHHFGGILVTPGYTDPIQYEVGTPYGPSHADGQGSIPVADATKRAAEFTGRRIVQITTQFKVGKSSVH